MNRINLLTLLLGVFVFTSFSQERDSRGYIVQVGGMTPDFEMKLTNDSTIKLSDYRGKVVMLQYYC